MNLLENYNTASQKYGIELVKQLTELGLPPQDLLSACRFVKENSIPLSNMINQFKEWTKFVTKYNKYDALLGRICNLTALNISICYAKDNL